MKRRFFFKRVFFSIGLFLVFIPLIQIGFRIYDKEEKTNRDPRDTFNSSLSRLDNLKKLITFTDSLAFEKGISSDSLISYAELADSIVKMRFFYGLQEYSPGENLLAFLSGKLLWSHLGAKVNPNHILKGQKAFCSQSSMVFQEMLKIKGFDIRTVRLENHFCTEVLLNGDWSFYDVSYKPVFRHSPRLSTAELIENPEYLQEAYLYSFKEDFSKNSLKHFNPEKISYGKVNAFAAPRMIWFHRITWFFSWFGWILFFGLYWTAKKYCYKTTFD